jgi:hypothetical protein
MLAENPFINSIAFSTFSSVYAIVEFPITFVSFDPIFSERHL